MGFGSCCSGVAVGIGFGLVCGFSICVWIAVSLIYSGHPVSNRISSFISLMLLVAEISQNQLGRTQLILHQGLADITFRLPKASPIVVGLD